MYGVGGRWSLEDSVSGSVRGYSYYYNSNPYWDTLTRKYSNTFPQENRTNAGFLLQLVFFTPSGFGLGYQLMQSMSIRSAEKAGRDIRSDTLRGFYTPIPYDYAINRTSMIHSISQELYLNGAEFSFRFPFNGTYAADLRLGVGYAGLRQQLRAEVDSVMRDYYQANGHIVYSERVEGAGVRIYGITYSSMYFYPQVTFSRAVNKYASVKATIGGVIMNIDKGAYIDQSTGDEFLLYPSKPFRVYNPTAGLGFSIELLSMKEDGNR